MAGGCALSFCGFLIEENDAFFEFCATLVCKVYRKLGSVKFVDIGNQIVLSAAEVSGIDLG